MAMMRKENEPDTGGGGFMAKATTDPSMPAPTAPTPADQAPPVMDAQTPPPDEGMPPAEEKSPTREKEDLSKGQEAQLERFYDNIIDGIGGGTSAQGRVAPVVEKLLTTENPKGSAGQLAEATAHIVAMALEGNIEKGVQLDEDVVIVAAGLVLDELAQIKEAMGAPATDDEVAQAVNTMLPTLFEKTQHLSFWNPETIQASVEELAQNPDVIEESAREADPEGAQALEQIPEDDFMQAEQAPPAGPAGGEAPPPAPDAGGVPPAMPPGGAPPAPAPAPRPEMQ